MRIPSNTWFCEPTRLSILNCILYLNLYSRFCTAHGRKSLYFLTYVTLNFDNMVLNFEPDPCKFCCVTAR